MMVRTRAAIAGAAAAAVALGVGELLGGILPGAPSPIAAVGALIIERQPPGAKDLMVALFGESDKAAFELIIAGASIILGAILGLIALRWLWVARAGFVGFGVLGFVAALDDPLVTSFLAGGTLVAAIAAGLVTLAVLIPMARALAPPGRESAPTVAASGSGLSASGARIAWPNDDAPGSTGPATPPSATRRRFLVFSGSAFGLALVSAVGGRYLATRRPSPVATAPVPPASEPMPSPPAGSAFDVPGLTPLVVPNDDFYRIDTQLTTPHIDADTWRLRVHGMVEREVELTYEQLVAMPLVERYVTIACVSNEVGGDLVGNAKWTGVPLQEVLDLAGVKDGATQLVGRAFDGWTCGFPTAHGGADGQEGLIAVKTNDEPLPAPHGFPARLIVPGLYGYVSATKWLTEIELTTLEAFDAYWVPLGWAKEAPIKTQSRIDVPRGGSRVAAGATVVAGVAWAPDRGISSVEVSIDEAAWQPAVLSRAISEDTWVQWRLDWDAPAGEHRIRCRATDATGATQTEERRPPAPDGATGYHEIRVNVG